MTATPAIPAQPDPAATTPPTEADAAAEVVVLVGNPRPGSRSRALAEAATESLVAGLARSATGLHGVRVLELATLVGVSFDAEPARGSAEVADPFEVVRSARLVIVATPTYKGSYTGLLKIFLDQFGHRGLAGVVAVPVTIAASDAHLRAVTNSLTDLLAELGATLPAEPLAALETQLTDIDALVAGWVDRQVGLVGGAIADLRVRA
ncbi:NAD(P)H-dependent oxidoreductase [Micromonospora sp. NBC_01699]|uniref:NAD(P)H-dependent oxidoreductase n=1 Tax=Micromonospora sp. NBC_01699 TaxID=2975984 RepID=UPI002E311A71|nr:NAD(P)H-dependent oxidoreductase [Micromonospora sp. NBC_01699]